MTQESAMSEEAELLRRYADDRSEAAFEEVVRRNLNLVYSAAIRQVGGNPAAAADIAQAVFTELACQANRLTRHPALVGWLYTTTHRMAARYVRDETRRRRREHEAHAMQETHRSTDPEADWNRLAPVLDEAMYELVEADRTALLLRHFQQRPYAEVGVQLGLSENAARMRVDRALERLRKYLARRGITSTASAVVLALKGPAVAAAPAGLAANISAGALAAGAVTASTFGLLSLMSSTPVKVGAVVVGCALLSTGLLVQRQSLQRLRVEQASLKEQLAEQSAALGNTRELLARKDAELAASRESLDELLRLRGEVARLRRGGPLPIQEGQSNPGPLPAGRLPAGENPEVLGLIEGLERTKRLMDGYGLDAAVAREKMQRMETDLQVPQEVVDSGRLPEPSSPELQKRLQPYFEVRLEFYALQRKRGGLMLRFAQEAFDQLIAFDEKGHGKTSTDWYGLQATTAREKMQRLQADLQVPQEVVDSGLLPEPSSPELRKRLQPYFEARQEADIFHRTWDGLRLRALQGRFEREAETERSLGNSPEVNP